MKQKSLILTVLVLALVGLSACTPANSSQPQQSQVPYTINTTGSGKVYISPDVAYINIGAHTEAETVSEALAQNNQQAQQLAKTMTDMGVDAKDIQTSSFSVAPLQKFDEQGQPTKKVYMVDNVIYVTVRDLSKLGKLLDAAVSSGANQVNSLTFDVKDKSKSVSEARKLAVADAQGQAKELADSLGVKLGKITSVNAYVSNGGTPLYDVKAPQAAVGSGASVPVSAGQMVVQVDATLTYEIVQ